MYPNTLPVTAGLLATLVHGSVAAVIKPREFIDAHDVSFPVRAVGSPLVAAVPLTTLVPFADSGLYRNRYLKRQSGGPGNYALATSDTWYWSLDGASSPNTMVTSSFEDNGVQDANGRSVTVERLMNDITQLGCTSTGLTITFKDPDSYNTAKTNWDWVNEDVDHYVAMIVNAPQCGSDRQLYRISDFMADDGSLTINAGGSPAAFQDVFPSLTLKMSGDGVTTPSSKRAVNSSSAGNFTRPKEDFGDIDKKFSIPLSHDFSVNIFDAKAGDVDVSLGCKTCNTAGSLNFDVDVGFSFSKGVSGSITVTPSGITATVGLGLSVEGVLNTAFEKSVSIINVGLPGGVSFAIGNIGPSLMVNADATISNVTAGVDVELGSITFSIDDSSKAVIDFSDSSNDQFTGFSPKFTTQGPSLSAQASVSGQLGIDIVFGLDAELFGKGLAAGLALAAPTLNVDAGVSVDSCNSGVEFDVELSAQLNAFAGVGKVADIAAQNTISIVGTTTQLFSTCITGLSGSQTTAPDASSPAMTTATTTEPAMTVTATSTDAPSATMSGIGTGSFGGTVGVTLNNDDCFALGAGAGAAHICYSAGGDDMNLITSCSTTSDLCCRFGNQCGNATSSDGVTGFCCF